MDSGDIDINVNSEMDTDAITDKKNTKQNVADITESVKMVSQQVEVDDLDRDQKMTIDPHKELEETTDPDNADKELVKQRIEEQHLIQIVASNEEINRRIGALIEQKQRELDENNCQEFCGVHPGFQDLENHCARTAAIFVPRAGGKSHIKVSRVVNMYGPQTRALGQTVNERHCLQGEHKPHINMMEGIEERLANMEEHLKLPGSTKTDVYGRLKNLEERILFLESLSPEYFTTGAPPVKRARKVSSLTKQSDINQDLSLSEIDSRIQALKDSLHQRYLQR